MSISRYCPWTEAQHSGRIDVMRNDPARMRRPGARGPAVAVVVCDGVTAFELGVASEVFGPTWGAVLGVPWYRLTVCALNPGPVTADSGFQVLAAAGPEAIRDADTVIVLPSMTADQIP